MIEFLVGPYRAKHGRDIFTSNPGNVVHAEIAQQRGLDAFRRMCFLTRGRFKFEPEFRAGERTMVENGMKMLLESARRHDELARDVAHCR